MITTSKTLSLLALAVLLSGCGKFGFGSRLAMEGRIAEAKFLTVDAGKALGYGVCSPVTVSAWAQAGVVGGSLTAVQFSLGGLRSGDLVFSDATCSKQVKADQLFLPAVAVSVTYYVKTASVGQVALVVNPATERFASVSQSVPVGVILAALTYNSAAAVTLPAGYCSSPIGINLKDGGGAAFSATNQTIQISGGEGIVFSDSACTSAVPAATLKVTGSSATVYLKKNSAVGGAMKLVARVPGNVLVDQAELSVTFSSVPHHIEIVGGPATNLVLGVCDAVGYQIRLLDVDGNLASPASGSNLTVQIGTSGPSSVNYRAACSGVSPILTNVVFAAGENSKTVFADARTQNSVTLRAWINNSAIAEAIKGPISVDRLPVSLQVVGSPSVLAGSPASFTVTLLDGLGNSMSTNNNVVVSLTESSGGYGAFSSNQIAILSGYSQSSFTYTPDVDAPTFTQGVNAVATIFNRTVRGSTSLNVNARVPVSIQISAGPAGAVDLGVCAPSAFNVTLLAADGNPVAPRTNSVSVAMGFSSGSGTYVDACGGNQVSSLAFGAGVSVLSLNLIPTADNSVTLRATSSGLNPGSKVVFINPAVPVAVVLTGPTAVTAGVPAGPFTVTIKDAINRNIAATSGGVSAPIGIASATRTNFCTTLKCSSLTSSMTVSIPQGSAVSSGFYLLSDSDSTQNPVAGGMSATPTNGLRASNLPLVITRTSLALDPTFASSGQFTAPIAGMDGGEIRASLYSGGKLTVAGFQTVNGKKRLAMARFNADRTLGNGALDTSFGNGGTMVQNLGDESWASALVAQGSGYLVAGVQRTNSETGGDDFNFLLVRVNSDGSLDSSFRFVAGAPDPLTLPGAQYATSVVVGSDNTIYVVGYGDPTSPAPSNTSDIIIAAFNPDGSAISGGVDTYDFAGNQEIATTALVQTSGGVDRIMIGGSIGMGSSSDALFLRVMGLRGSNQMMFLAGDPNFGNGGMVRYDLGGYGDSIRSMVMQPSNRLVAVGSRGKSSGSSVSMIGLSFNGNKDAGFGSNGIANYDISGVNSGAANDIALDSRTGAIYLAGSADNSLLLARYNQDGTSDGMASTARVFGSAPVGYSIALGQDSKPLVGGVNGGVFALFSALR